MKLIIGCIFVITIGIVIRFNIISQGPPGKGCNDIAILLPATAREASRWDEKDGPYLEGALIKENDGVTIRYFNANSNLEKQNEQADLALNKGSCILVVAPVDTKGASEIVQKAKAKKVPVIAYDRFIDDNDLAFYVSFDSKKVGELQARYVLEQLEEGEKGKYKLKKGANVVMINGDAGDRNTKMIEEGWFEVLQPSFDSKDLNLVFPKQKGDPNYFMKGWSGDQAAETVKSLLDEYQNNIPIILVANDGMAEKIINILKQKQKQGEVLVTGQDGGLNSARYIVEGFQGITLYKPIIDGLPTQTIAVIKAWRAGQKPLDNNQVKTETEHPQEIPAYLVPPKEVTSENIEGTLMGELGKDKVCANLKADPYKLCQ